MYLKEKSQENENCFQLAVLKIQHRSFPHPCLSAKCNLINGELPEVVNIQR